MDPYISEWLNLAVRWIHIITGIAWIGSSFFFMWLDSHLTAPKTPRQGVEGELWMTHSGGFYQVEKMQLTPAEVPSTLHWFKWEAAFTWISGFVLLILVYYLGASVYLIDPAVSAIGPGWAVALGLAILAATWLVYDGIWSSAFGRSGWPATLASALLIAGLAYALTQVFSGRGAYIHVGAVMGTVMVLNVWVRIIPAQRQLVAATKAGTAPDARLAANAKQRSVHNNYMTLPVVFVMVSSHYPATYGHPYNWAILLALFLIGAGVRDYFNRRNRGRNPLWIPALAVVAMAVLAYVVMPRPPGGEAEADAAPVSFAAVRLVLAERCQVCHSATPTNENFDVAPKGVMFDTPQQIKRRVSQIKATAVVTRIMPLGNLTEMTQAERDLLARWIRAGAPVD